MSHGHRTERRRLWLVVLGACLLLAGASLSPSSGPAPHPAAAGAETVFSPPPVGHVWVINLENVSYDDRVGGVGSASFGSAGPSSPVPYLANDLPAQGALLTQYYGVGHNSLDNYIAQISGQAPNEDTQGDCAGYSDFNYVGPGPHGQAVGKGCVFPASVQTLAYQLEHKQLTWKSYQEDMGDDSAKDGGTRCAHPPLGGTVKNTTFDEYAPKHDPFVFFHSVIGSGSSHSDRCRASDVPLTELAGDLKQLATTPNFSYITPNNQSDAHDAPLEWSDVWLRQVVPEILASPAYRQDGMLVVTFDEAGGFGTNPIDNTSCCNEIPGPNGPRPGIGGPGGGRVGAVVLSPFIDRGTRSDPGPSPTNSGPGYYNHYSLLRSVEDLFRFDGGDDGMGHLGFAGTYPTTYPGPGSFGPDVYSANRSEPAQPRLSPATDGPLPADGSTAWEAPLPRGEDLGGVSCTDVTHCVAVGDRGTIVTTSDGSTWSAQSSPTSQRLSGVNCPTQSHCVAVGDEGTILTTDDGGRNWSLQPSQTKRALSAVACPTVIACVTVGDAGTILATVDGGAHWLGRSAGLPAPNTSRLASVACPSAIRCFAVGDAGTILTSGDGGVTWSAQTSPAELASSRYFGIACTDATHCLAVADSNTAAKTSDGATWQAAKLGFDALVATLGVSCAGSSSCLMVGRAAYRFPVFGDRTPGSFRPATVDGSWPSQWLYDAQNEADHRFDALSAVSCPSTSACFAVGENGALVRFAALPATSSDPRPTWTQQRTGPTRDLAGISCPGAATCFAVGDGVPICTTGGATACPTHGVTRRSSSAILARDSEGAWTLQDSNVPQRLDAVSCASPATCVAVGDLGAVTRTTDGSHWSAVGGSDAARKGTSLLGVSCPAGTSLCVAVGDHGTALRSTDGGVNWAKASSGTPEFLNAVSCATATDCVAVGSFGAVVRSTDGGASWSKGSSGTVLPLLGVSCPTAQQCYAVGAGGTVLASGDGGANWAAQSTPIGGQDLTGVNCSSATTCAAAGSNGAVVATGSGGETWQAQGTGTARLLTGVSCPTTSSCYEAGERGSILRTAPRVSPASSKPGPAGDNGSGLRGLTPGCRGPVPTSQILRSTIRVRQGTLSFSGRSRIVSGCLDAGAARIRRVEVAVARVANGRCRFLQRTGRLGPPRSCRRPAFLPVSLRRRGATVLWQFRSRRPLPRGTYRLMARSAGRPGEVEAPVGLTLRLR